MQMQLSQKQKLFSESVSAFFKSILKFGYLQTEVDPDSWFISEITDSEKRA